MKYLLVFFVGCFCAYLALAWINLDLKCVAWPGTDGQGIRVLILILGCSVTWIYAIFHGDMG